MTLTPADRYPPELRLVPESLEVGLKALLAVRADVTLGSGC